MAYPQTAYDESTCSQLFLPELPPVAVNADGTAAAPDPAHHQPNAEPPDPLIPPEHFRVQPGDRPSSANAPNERPRHPFGPKDDRTLVWNMKRPALSRQDAIALVEACKDAYRACPNPTPPWAGHDPDVCNAHPAPEGVVVPPWPTEEGELRIALGRRLIELETLHRPVYDRIVNVLESMNGCVVDTTPIASALLACNACSYPIGCRESAKQILFYLVRFVDWYTYLTLATSCASALSLQIKYLCKDPCEIASTAAFLCSAYEKVKTFPSRQENQEEHREAVHLLQVLLNKINGASELADTQACSALLNLASHCSSATFSYVYARYVYAVFDRAG